MKSHALAIIAALLVIAPSGLAQESIPESPEEITRLAADYVAAGDWAGFSSLMAPGSLDRFRESMLPVMEGVKDIMARAIENGEEVSPELQDAIATIAEAPADSFFAVSFSIIFSILPEMSEAMTSLQSEVIGSVYENDSLVHVVTRSSTTVQGITMDDAMDVVSLRKTEQGWRMLLSAEIRGMAQVMRRALGGQPAPTEEP